MSTPGSGQGSYTSSVQPPGGLGVSSQGYGQEGYVLQDDQVLPQPPDEALNFATGVPYFLEILAVFDALPGFVGAVPR